MGVGDQGWLRCRKGWLRTRVSLSDVASSALTRQRIRSGEEALAAGLPDARVTLWAETLSAREATLHEPRDGRLSLPSLTAPLRACASRRGGRERLAARACVRCVCARACVQERPCCVPGRVRTCQAARASAARARCPARGRARGPPAPRRSSVHARVRVR
eukprot:3718370-Pleurochrysis_carterae.AAC.1